MGGKCLRRQAEAILELLIHHPCLRTKGQRSDSGSRTRSLPRPHRSRSQHADPRPAHMLAWLHNQAGWPAKKKVSAQSRKRSLSSTGAVKLYSCTHQQFLLACSWSQADDQVLEAAGCCKGKLCDLEAPAAGAQQRRRRRVTVLSHAGCSKAHARWSCRKG